MRKYVRTTRNYLAQCDYIVLGCLLCGICLGIIYAIFLKDQYALYYSIGQLVQNHQRVDTQQVIRDSFVAYFLQLGIVLLGCMYRWARGLSYLVIIFIGISYGFSVSCIILLYGIKGIIASILLLIVPVVILLVSILYITFNKEKLRTKEFNKVGLYWGGVSVICAVISAFNAYIHPLIEQFVYHVL